ncbi:hypothetical protein CAPTEDRAFT_196681, partial [Capitella teleta]
RSPAYLVYVPEVNRVKTFRIVKFVEDGCVQTPQVENDIDTDEPVGYDYPVGNGASANQEKPEDSQGQHEVIENKKRYSQRQTKRPGYLDDYATCSHDAPLTVDYCYFVDIQKLPKMFSLLLVLPFLVTFCQGSPSPDAQYEMLLGGNGFNVPLKFKWRVGTMPRSCKDILAENGEAHSGEYYLSVGRKFVLVYCEMGLNGGGYTFLHPSSFPTMSDEHLQEIFTDKTSFVMRTLRSDGRQTVSVLEQLSDFK